MNNDCQPRTYPSPVYIDALIPLSPEVSTPFKRIPGTHLQDSPNFLPKFVKFGFMRLCQSKQLHQYTSTSLSIHSHERKTWAAIPEQSRYAPLSILFSQQPVMKGTWQDSPVQT